MEPLRKLTHAAGVFLQRGAAAFGNPGDSPLKPKPSQSEIFGNENPDPYIQNLVASGDAQQFSNNSMETKPLQMQGATSGKPGLQSR